MAEKQTNAQQKKTLKAPAHLEHWGLSLTLACLMHAVLFVGLFVVFQWNRQSEEVFYAELWNEQPAPIQTPVKPEPKPEQKVEPAPEPEPEPEPELKPEPQPEPEIDQEAIRLEQEKALQEKKAQEEKLRQEQLAREKAQREKLERERQARRQAAAKALAQQMQQEELKRAQANTDNAAGRLAGQPGQSQSALYNARVAACVRANLYFPVEPNMKRGQYVAVYEVKLTDDGTKMAALRQLKSSGLTAYDVAVERAIKHCDPWPVMPNGQIVKRIELTFDPVDN